MLIHMDTCQDRQQHLPHHIRSLTEHPQRSTQTGVSRQALTDDLLNPYRFSFVQYNAADVKPGRNTSGARRAQMEANWTYRISTHDKVQQSEIQKQWYLLTLNEIGACEQGRHWAKSQSGSWTDLSFTQEPCALAIAPQGFSGHAQPCLDKQGHARSCWLGHVLPSLCKIAS